MLKLKGKMIWYYFYEPQDTRRGVKKRSQMWWYSVKKGTLYVFFQTHILWLSHDWAVVSVSFVILVLEKMIFFVLSSTNNHLPRSQTKLVWIPSRLSIHHVRVFIYFFWSCESNVIRNVTRNQSLQL